MPKTQREVHPVYKRNWTAHEKEVWEMFLAPKYGQEEDGFWAGHCPMHDPECQSPGSAGFNFDKGSWRCNRQSGSCLAPKKQGSTSNLLTWIEKNLLGY
jgi:hypothetical protein